MNILDTNIAEWRAALLRNSAVSPDDADELETHLREQADDLVAVGLSEDEAFLVAVRRLGEVNRLTAEFAREHSDRLWKQLIPAKERDGGERSLWIMIGFAVLAAVVIQIGRLIAENGNGTAAWFPRNAGLLVIPVLAAYFVVARKLPIRVAAILAGITLVLGVLINVFPYADGSQTELIVGLHLPVALWFIVGVAYGDGQVRSSARRMDFIRFTGEWAIYYVLLALGGGVLMSLTALVLIPIAPDVYYQVFTWVPISAAAAGFVIAAWLVEAKKSIIENLAPVLTAIFTPFFAIMLLGSAIAYLVVGVQGDFDRDVLIGFDVLLIVVLGLVVYGISARREGRMSRFSDLARLVAVAAALVLDVVVLIVMLQRIGDVGFTPNRLVALGLNLVLLVNLAVTAVLATRALAGRGTTRQIERWQTGYLTVFAAWVLAVIVVVPPLFAFA